MAIGAIHYDGRPMDLVCITIDSREPERLARFWRAALGGAESQPGAGGNLAICDLPANGLYLEFIRVAERKGVKNRLHFGCSVGSLDQFDAEFERLVGLGARLAWKEMFPPDVATHYRNWVLVDPEGNEFCLGGGWFPEGVTVPSEVPIERA